MTDEERDSYPGIKAWNAQWEMEGKLDEILGIVRALRQPPPIAADDDHRLHTALGNEAAIRHELERLRAENAKLLELAEENDELRMDRTRNDREVDELTAENAAIRKSIGDGDYGPTAQELQRFRAREEKVTALLVIAEKVADRRSAAHFWRENAPALNDAIAAVRDFKVKP
jgi:hypothetical protein